MTHLLKLINHHLTKHGITHERAFLDDNTPYLRYNHCDHYSYIDQNQDGTITLIDAQVGIPTSQGIININQSDPQLLTKVTNWAKAHQNCKPDQPCKLATSFP